MNPLPLLHGFSPESVVAWRHGRAIVRWAFLSQVAALAARLPERRYVINSCEDRYLFLVGWAAAMVRGQINLLPPSRTPHALEQIAGDYPDVYCLVDQPGPTGPLGFFIYQGEDSVAQDAPMPCFPPEQCAAIAFTSGSTGRSMPHPKSWGSLVTGAQMAGGRFSFDARRPRAIVATVPPQHMYGLETTIMLPIQFGCAMHSGRPFFPADIAAALAGMPVPRVLVTTPVHLRACVVEAARFPALEFVLSATAPLSVELARTAEAQYRTQVLEIYGCTEAGSIASRRTVSDSAWRVYDDMRLLQADGGHCVSGPQLAAAVPLNDVIIQHGATEFTLIGRSADLVNIAGKRISLGDLNHKLTEIPGVIDGAFFMPEETEGQVTRLMAFVVAPALSAERILTELRQKMDAVFLPRPLCMVDALPRTESGKLPRERLLQLAARALGREDDRQAV